MKKLSLLALLTLLISLTSFAQFKKGNWELSLSGSFGSNSYKQELQSTYSSYSPSTSNSTMYFLINAQPSYYIIDGLALGASINFITIENTDPTWSLLGSVSYTYLVPNSNMAPFLRLGYGVSNGYSGFNMMYALSNSTNMNVLDLGAGLKVLLSKNTFLKIELNYNRQSWSKDYNSTSYSLSTDYTYSNIGVLFGLGISL
jgi:hypothetical protein